MARLAKKWLGERAFHGPALRQTDAEGRNWDAQFCRPLAEQLRASMKGQATVLAGIAGLLLHGGPTTVVGAVGAVIVDAVQRVQRRGSRTHVGQKGLKTVTPAVAHHNAAGTVAVIEAASWIATPLDGVAPRAIFGCAAAAMRPPHVAEHAAFATSARRRGAARQGSSLDDGRGAAVALTAPVPAARFDAYPFNDVQARKPQTGEFKLTHDMSIIITLPVVKLKTSASVGY